jgi:type VI secretion system secreted protein Hcp
VASSIHIKLDGVPGESKDSKHAGEIEVQSWSWGVTHPVATGSGAGSAVGKAAFNDLTFVHQVDRATPKLWEFCATGKHIRDAKLSSGKPGVPGQDYLVITLKDVVVTSVSTSQADGGPPSEFVSLNFTKVDLEYKPQKPDGSLSAGIHFKFDLKTHKAG